MAKKTWDIGNIFCVELSDSSHVIGQVIGREAEVLNSITSAFFSLKFDEMPSVDTLEELDESKLIACQFITKDLLTKRVWKVIGAREPIIAKENYPYEHCRENGWIGAEMHGSGIMVKFLEAYYALGIWDDWYDPNYLDEILWKAAKKPDNLRYKSAS
ncbi:MAG: Imm26 family immunity protein [Kangiellaceae bacterium]